MVNQPLVSIVTPFYNTEDYLKYCIESVLGQTYENWEYILVNNCSNDKSLEIAHSYAKREPRIRIFSNEIFLSQVRNYNHAIRLISKESKYCKIVQADDMIFPECLVEMVNVAEEYPTVGIVLSYWINDNCVCGGGISYPSTYVSGKDICRWQLLNHPDKHSIGTPTAHLIRSDLIRNRDPFYDEKYHPFEDYEVWLELLKNNDFGFVHKILTYQRSDNESISNKIRDYSPNLLVAYICLKKYGRYYLTEEEYSKRLQIITDRHFNLLANSMLYNKYHKKLFDYHESGLKVIGESVNKNKLYKYLFVEFLDVLRHPKLAVKLLSGILKK